MTTPSSQFRSQQLLLVLPLSLLVILAAAAEGGLPMPRPDCPDKCGDIGIPFPFGIGPGCFRHGFEVLCNDSFVPPRAFLADNRTYKGVREGYHPSETEWSPRDTKWSWSPLELVSISLATGEARAYAGVSYRCSTNLTGAISTSQRMSFYDTLFAVSATRNVLIGVGWSAEPLLRFYYRSGPTMFSCLAYDSSLRLPARNGSCTGRGCCEHILSPDEGPGRSFTLWVKEQLSNREWETKPCSYAMVAEKSSCNFSTPDLSGNKTLLERIPQGVHLVLDFVAGNAPCPSEGQPPPPDYACVSGNSTCANVTYGYVCKCRDHYAGNPYITNGCQDIDECKLPDVYNCTNGGICKNRLGGYDCPCKFGMKRDGKGATCTDVFPLAAKETVGAIGGILLMVILLFLVILRKEKKKTEEFFKKNGGPTLEKANVIKLFKREELKPILKNSNLVGKGRFGEVYKGLLNNKEVAIKKPIHGSVLENEQFANEVIIQCQVIHKNIVRLIGCCLEVDAPMLVYEFISQGSLHDILHNNNKKVALNLDERLSIISQSADGLAYMHSKANIRILHGDVKPANILLDDNFTPKISDFGISRLLAREKEHTGSVIGDMNYMDPVYLQEGLLTEKNDVYSFGVVILELISSRRAIHYENNSLVKSFLEARKKQKKATEFFDKEIAIIEDLELLESLADIAVECLSLDVDQRPTMEQVAERLHILSRSWKVQDVCHLTSCKP